MPWESPICPVVPVGVHRGVLSGTKHPNFGFAVGRAPFPEVKDSQLLAAFIRTRDDAAFGRLVARHAGSVRRVALLATGNAAAAEDVTQAAYIVLARRPRPALRSAQRRGSVEPWLHKVARYAAANWRRVEQRRRRHELASLARKRAASEPSQSTDLAEAVAAALRQLSTRDRRLIVLRHIEEKPWSELAAIVRMSPEAARKAAARAMQRLRIALESAGVTASPAVLLAGLATAPAAAVGGGSVSAANLATGVITMMKAKLAVACCLVAAASMAVGAVAVPSTISAVQQRSFQTQSILVAPSKTTPASQTLPDDVREQLERNARALPSVTIRWMQQMKPNGDRREIAKLVGMQAGGEDYLFSQQRLTFALGERSEFRNTIVTPMQTSEQSFDGEIFYAGHPPVERPEGTVPGGFTRTEVSRMEASHFPWVDPAYLRAAGFVIPATTDELAKRTPFASLPLYLLGSGGRVSATSWESQDGRRLFRLEIEAPNPDRERALKVNLDLFSSDTQEKRKRIERLKRARTASPTRSYVFLLDASLGYSVRAFAELDEGRPVLSGTNDDFEQVGDRGVWLPKTCAIDAFSEHYMYPEVRRSPIYRRLMNVEEISTAELPIEHFRVIYNDPGTLVADRLPGQSGIYEIPVGAASLEDAIARGRAIRAHAPGRGLLDSWWTVSTIVGASLVALAMLVWFARRRLAR